MHRCKWTQVASSLWRALGHSQIDVLRNCDDVTILPHWLPLTGGCRSKKVTSQNDVRLVAAEDLPSERANKRKGAFARPLHLESEYTSDTFTGPANAPANAVSTPVDFRTLHRCSQSDTYLQRVHKSSTDLLS